MGEESWGGEGKNWWWGGGYKRAKSSFALLKSQHRVTKIEKLRNEIISNIEKYGSKYQKKLLKEN